MDAVQRLRQAMTEVDPALLSVDDRLALLDLIERTFTAGGGLRQLPSAARRRSSSISSRVS